MIKTGRFQEMSLKRFSTVGAYLVDLEEGETEVLLPKKYLQEDFKEDLVLRVFVYRDSEDRLVATTESPLAVVGDLAVLKVLKITEQGAFLDWGLEKDLFLPHKEQNGHIEEGKSFLVVVYLDRSDRVCATMHVSKYLRDDSPYKTDDWVEGVVYSLHEEFGAYVAVDSCFNARIPSKELFEELEFGQAVKARVTKVHEDGKLELSLREKSYLQRDQDSEIIMAALGSGGGYLALNDNSDPEAIKMALKMSKKAFKRAVGKLFKEGVIVIEENGIKLK